MSPSQPRATPPPPPTRRELLLQAYHDGELSRLARWRVERRLRRDPALRRELAALAEVGAWVRDGHGEVPAPDLWDAIALRLPAADARRGEAPARRRVRALGWLVVPGAVAASAVLAIAFLRGGPPVPGPERGGVVRWLDSGGRDVMVLEGAPDTTIIWVIDGPERDAL